MPKFTGRIETNMTLSKKVTITAKSEGEAAFKLIDMAVNLPIQLYMSKGKWNHFVDIEEK